EKLDEGARDWASIVIDDRHQQIRPVVGVEESLGDHRDDDDRHQERERERRAVAEEDPEVLAEDGQHGAQDPWPSATFARRRWSKPWNESFATAESNWARKFFARLTPSTVMSVARQVSPARRIV